MLSYTRCYTRPQPRGITDHIVTEMRRFDREERHAKAQTALLQTLVDRFDDHIATQKRVDDCVAVLEQRTSSHGDEILVKEFANVREDITTLTASMDSLKETIEQVREQRAAVWTRDAKPSAFTP